MNKLAHILLVEDNRMDVELTLDAFHEAKAAQYHPRCFQRTGSAGLSLWARSVC